MIEETTMKILAILFFIVCVSHNSQAVEIEYRISKAHGLYVFADTIAGAPHRSRTLKVFYRLTSPTSPRDS